ncbi:Pyrethroid hydrolase [Takifugu flavidus]|uniref:Pyrethroid hydrolase n=1 Tax=Takifugu flavidus TaxID=433684 RepID=A0A5C6P9S0_9TELE|nr:Pyrethroid hydrolase [Takifugu flavidus]
MKRNTRSFCEMKSFAFVISAFLLCVAADKYVPEIHTKLGSLRGKYESVKGKDTGVHAYLGVPFAKPPVGPALRLAAPQPGEGWEGVRDATKQPLMCVQEVEYMVAMLKASEVEADITDISEDCLYLNIYTPANRPENAKLPIQALKWVQEHIHNFGGDPDLVTIFGESAGGISVSLLLLSPLAEGLFHRAIAESGTAPTYALGQDPLPSFQLVANVSGCSAESTEKTADCIKSLDMETIVTIAKYFAPPNWTEGMDQEHVLGMLSMFYPDPKDEQLRKQILDKYTGSGEDRVKNRDGFTELLGDVLFVIPAIKTANAHRAPEIRTKLGSLRGKYESVKGKDTGVHAYLGVPFAKPPVGPALRLAAPQPVEGWEGVRDATKQPLMCIQDLEFAMDVVKAFGFTVDLPDISEDCLYLNVYTPANRPDNAKLPVMVWIHGGGFVWGSASTYSGSALAAYQDVVVVVIQYRLGLLGFLSTGDEHMPGNNGFLDQIQALKWVQEHIHNFGGDPDLVTIFGESAGGISVSLLLLSPLSEGLFHRAIAESGTAAMQLLVQGDPQPALQLVANVSGCTTESTEKTVECIKNMDMETTLALAKYFAPPNWTEGMDQEHVSGMLSMFYPDPKDEQLRKQILDKYTGTGEDRVKNRDGFTEMLGDVLFVIPAIKTANAHRGACSEEDERMNKIMMSYWGNFARTGSPNGQGLVHWPKYGEKEDYLAIDANNQNVFQGLKKDKFVVLTQTPLENFKEQKDSRHTEF